MIESDFHHKSELQKIQIKIVFYNLYHLNAVIIKPEKTCYLHINQFEGAKINGFFFKI